MNLIERLKELEAKATPGPWWYNDGYGAEVESSHVTVAGTERGLGKNEVFNTLTGLSDRPPEVCEINAKLITEMRNALPKLLEFVRWWDDCQVVTANQSEKMSALLRARRALDEEGEG